MSTVTEERTRRRTDAAEVLAARLNRSDADQVVSRLDAGLTLLRNLCFTRIHTDVERNFGVDSMIMPLSQVRTEQKTKGEIEVFAISEAVTELRDSCLAGAPAEWLSEWLLDLRLGGAQDRAGAASRLASYLRLDFARRYLAFSDVLERAHPEARHAPLVLYQLFPLSVRVATALALGNHDRAAELRGKQKSLLSAIADCRACRGRLFEVDETCRECGNPLWTIRWLSQD